MGYTTPTTRSNGEFIDAADWNTDLTDNITFLANPLDVHVYASGHATIANNTDTAVAFNNERRDNGSMHDNVTFNTRMTAPIAGLYQLSLNIAFSANATGIRVAYFRINGATNAGLDIRSAASADVTSFCNSTEVKLAANDYVEVVVKQTSGGNLALTEVAQFSPEAKMRYAGIG